MVGVSVRVATASGYLLRQRDPSRISTALPTRKLPTPDPCKRESLRHAPHLRPTQYTVVVLTLATRWPLGPPVLFKHASIHTVLVCQSA
jgi:hypothetical protein